MAGENAGLSERATCSSSPAAVYSLTAIVLLVLGRAGVHFESNTWWALLAAVCVVGALIFLYVALETAR